MIILSTLKVVSSITVFLLLVLTLITILLFVKAKLSPAGKIKIMINIANGEVIKISMKLTKKSPILFALI